MNIVYDKKDGRILAIGQAIGESMIDIPEEDFPSDFHQVFGFGKYIIKGGAIKKVPKFVMPKLPTSPFV